MAQGSILLYKFEFMDALHNAIMGFFDNDISDILKLDGSHK